MPSIEPPGSRSSGAARSDSSPALTRGEARGDGERQQGRGRGRDHPPHGPPGSGASGPQGAERRGTEQGKGEGRGPEQRREEEQAEGKSAEVTAADPPSTPPFEPPSGSGICAVTSTTASTRPAPVVADALVASGSKATGRRRGIVDNPSIAVRAAAHAVASRAQSATRTTVAGSGRSCAGVGPAAPRPAQETSAISARNGCRRPATPSALLTATRSACASPTGSCG